MKLINTNDGRTLWLNTETICYVNYDKTNGNAILSLKSGEVIQTAEFAPELLRELNIITEEEAEQLEKQLEKEGVTGTKTGQK